VVVVVVVVIVEFEHDGSARSHGRPENLDEDLHASDAPPPLSQRWRSMILVEN
jgi:hypothetical protein